MVDGRYWRLRNWSAFKEMVSVEDLASLARVDVACAWGVCVAYRWRAHVLCTCSMHAVRTSDVDVAYILRACGVRLACIWRDRGVHAAYIWRAFVACMWSGCWMCMLHVDIASWRLEDKRKKAPKRLNISTGRITSSWGTSNKRLFVMAHLPSKAKKTYNTFFSRFLFFLSFFLFSFSPFAQEEIVKMAIQSEWLFRSHFLDLFYAFLYKHKHKHVHDEFHAP